MKAAIYSPYLDTLGGGEKYILTIAEVLSKNGFNVNVLLDKHLAGMGGGFLRETISKRFNLDLKDVDFILGPVGKGSDIFSRSSFLKNYNILFYLTDGSIFYPTAKRNTCWCSISNYYNLQKSKFFKTFTSDFTF